MERKKIYLGDGELIVGERGTEAESVSHISGVLLPFDGRLRSSNTREKTPYTVDDEALRIQREQVLPYWRERAIRES